MGSAKHDAYKFDRVCVAQTVAGPLDGLKRSKKKQQEKAANCETANTLTVLELTKTVQRGKRQGDRKERDMEKRN